MLLHLVPLLHILLIVGCEPTPLPSVEPSTTEVLSTTPSSSSVSSDLTEEGQEQVAILKQINRVNEDGSYTFGYEAADGSFKIETRDIAGNVKGMFGFVDEGGELKRVSYSASNGTGFQSTGTPNIPPLVTPADIDTSTRISLLPDSIRHSTTEGTVTDRPTLPVYIYKTSTHSPRPEVIQHIPRLRPTPASLSTEPTESAEITSTRRPTLTTFLPRKSSTPHYITLKTTTARPSGNFEEDDEPVTRRPSVVQTFRPRNPKKIIVSKRPVEVTTTVPIQSTTRVYPVTILSDKEPLEELQRQIDSNTVTEPGLTASGTEDSPDVFGGGPTSRPYPAAVYRSLFNPIPQYQRILQASQLQNFNQNGNSGGRLQAGPLPYPPSGRGQLPPNPRLTAQYQPPTGLGQNAPPYPISDGRPLPPSAPAGPDPSFQLVSNPSRPYQGLAFPSGRGRPGLLPLPGGYQEVPSGPDPSPKLPNPTPYDEQYPQQYPVNPRQPQTLPPSSYNPAVGLTPAQNLPVRGQQQPIPYPQDQQYPYQLPRQPAQFPQNPLTAQSSNLLMEQLLRMLLAAQIQSQLPRQPTQFPQNPLTPFQQALLASLGLQNTPQDLSGRYEPRYQGYQQRPPNYQPPLPPYPPQYDPYVNQGPYPQPNPYINQGSYPQPSPFINQGPYPQPNPYINQGPFMGYSPQQYQNQYNPQEVFLRFLLSGRYPTPQVNPEIQNSPAAFDRGAEYNQPRPQIQPRRPQLPEPSLLYGQRLPAGSNIVERSPSNSQRTPTNRQVSKVSGSRNVQILEQESAETSATDTTTKSRE